MVRGLHLVPIPGGWVIWIFSILFRDWRMMTANEISSRYRHTHRTSLKNKGCKLWSLWKNWRSKEQVTLLLFKRLWNPWALDHSVWRNGCKALPYYVHFLRIFSFVTQPISVPYPRKRFPIPNDSYAFPAVHRHFVTSTPRRWDGQGGHFKV